jgi:hypothetical protein
MKRFRRLATMLAGVGAAMTIFAGPVRADVTGSQAFYFTASCTGIGDVLLVNAFSARAAALQVVGTHTVVLVGSEPSGSPGLQNLAARAGTTCTFTGFGPSPNQIQPLNPPLTAPAVITGG